MLHIDKQKTRSDSTPISGSIEAFGIALQLNCGDRGVVEKWNMLYTVANNGSQSCPFHFHSSKRDSSKRPRKM